MTTLRDIALISASDPQVVAEAHELAGRWNGALVIELALAVTADVLGTASTGLARIPSSHVQRLALRSYRSQGGSNAALRLAGTVALPRWSDRAAYLLATGMPSRSYRRARSKTDRAPEWSRGVTELFGRRP